VFPVPPLHPVRPHTTCRFDPFQQIFVLTAASYQASGLFQDSKVVRSQ
jgi:hypothetical protein